MRVIMSRIHDQLATVHKEFFKPEKASTDYSVYFPGLIPIGCVGICDINILRGIRTGTAHRDSKKKNNDCQH
jgi:hypothetical protein